MKQSIVSDEGHRFNSRQEVMDELLCHSGNKIETGEYLYSPEILSTWSDEELVEFLGDCFSVKFRKLF